MANESAKFMKNAFIGWTDTHGMYYPTDFDPSKLVSKDRYLGKKKSKKDRGQQMMNIRMMMPFSMVCGTCGEYTYVGTKFNSRVERIRGQDYFGAAIYRFYGKCQHCASEHTFKTDPKTADYVMESGGSRSYECWKDADTAEESMAKNKEEEAEFDAMKALEHASASAAAEMELSDAIEEQLMMNKRGRKMEETISQALDFLYKKHAAELEGPEDDTEDFEEELEAFRQEKTSKRQKELDREIEDSILDDALSEATTRPVVKKAKVDPSLAAVKPSAPPTFVVKSKMPSPPILIKKKKAEDPAEASAPTAPPGGGVLGASYDSDSESKSG